MKLKTRLFKLFPFTVFLAFLIGAVAYKSRLANDENNTAVTGTDTTKKSKDSLNEIIIVGYSPKHGRLIDPARKKEATKSPDSSLRKKEAISKVAVQLDTNMLPKPNNTVTADTTHHH
jgi:hypothetical protein